MYQTSNSERGFALPAALFGLVVVGVLVTGGFYVARQESRIGVANQHASKALYLAERGVSDVVTTYGVSAVAGLPVWGDTTFTNTMSDGTWDVTVTRTNAQTFFLDGTGTVTLGGYMLGGAQRRVGMIAKVFSANINPPAALSTQGKLKIGGSSVVNGIDEIPTELTSVCDASTLDDKAGIMIDDLDNINTLGKWDDAYGDPPILEDDTITAESLLNFGGMTFDDLAALADIDFFSSETITGTAPDSVFVGGDWVCNTSDKYNWGYPQNPNATCGSYLPIIYAHSDLHIASSASGQGILLVEGDLKLTGGYEFFGAVIVKGKLSTQGTGGHVVGALIAANVELNTSTVLGNALVQYSSCTLSRATLNNSSLTRFRPIADRSWVDLSNLGN